MKYRKLPKEIEAKNGEKNRKENHHIEEEKGKKKLSVVKTHTKYVFAT